MAKNLFYCSTIGDTQTSKNMRYRPRWGENCTQHQRSGDLSGEKSPRGKGGVSFVMIGAFRHSVIRVGHYGFLVFFVTHGNKH